MLRENLRECARDNVSKLERQPVCFVFSIILARIKTEESSFNKESILDKVRVYGEGHIKVPSHSA